MSGIATAVAGGSLISGFLGSQAAGNAANTQAQAGTYAAQLQQQTAQQQMAQQLAMYQQNVARQQPWVTSGQQAQQTLADLMGTSGNVGAADYGSLGQSFNASDLNANLAPSYAFQLQQGMQAEQASQAAQGGLLTGQGQKDIQQYAQNYASTGYQQAYQNYVTNQTNLYNRLTGMSQTGQAAAAGVGAAGQQTGANIAQTAMTGAQGAAGYATSAAGAQAAGQIGQANAWTGAINTGLNTGMMMNYLQGGGGGGTVPNLGGAANPYAQVGGQSYQSMIPGMPATPLPAP